MKHSRVVGAGLLVLAVAALQSQAGSTKGEKGSPPAGIKAPGDAPAKVLVVPVARPVQRQVTDFMDFTGHTSAVNSVTIVPRVTGYLVKTSFKEGADVRSGDLLFEIDPRPYQARLDALRAGLAQSSASLRLAEANYARLLQIVQKNPGAVSQGELDQHRGQKERAVAALERDKASLEEAKLNLAWTKVAAPIDGRIGRASLTVGNLLTRDVTHLTTLVSLEPMYVYFEMDEASLLRIKRAVNQGTVKPGVMAPVLMALQGEDGYPHAGTLNFIDNQVDPATGTIKLRGVFANPKPKDGTRVLLPGMFARVRLPVGQPRQALLVIDRALLSDQGVRYVYVVNADKQVEYRRVTPGALQPDGLRVIEQGLKPDDWVVIGGFTQLRPRLTVQPDQVPMPALVQPDPKLPGSVQQPPATEKARLSEAIQTAQKERHDLLARAVDQLIALSKGGRVDFARVVQVERDLLRATVDHGAAAERKAALEELQQTAAHLVQMAEVQYKAGLILEADVLQTRAVLLEVRIALLREAVKVKEGR